MMRGNTMSKPYVEAEFKPSASALWIAVLLISVITFSFVWLATHLFWNFVVVDVFSVGTLLWWQSLFTTLFIVMIKILRVGVINNE
jgi:hypothetical protein